MATIDPIRFKDIAVLLGNGATPTELFEQPCGITDLTWTTNTQTQDEDLPDCDDPDVPGYNAPRVISQGDQVQFQGFVDVDSHDAWLEFIQSGEEKNVRLAYTKGTKDGWYAGKAVMTNREESYVRRQSGRISGTIAFVTKPTWVDAP